jgi:hypothetical protein
MADNALNFEPPVTPVQPTQQLNFEPTLNFEPQTTDAQPTDTQQKWPSVSDQGIPIVGDNTPEGMSKYQPLPKDQQEEDVAKKQYSDILAQQKAKEDAKYTYDHKSGDIAPDFVPNTTMYDKDSDPNATYETLKSKAKEFSIAGEPIINGRIVPKPGAYDWTPSKESALNPFTTVLGISPKVQQNVSDSVREGTRNVLETAAATLDEALGHKDSPITKMVYKYVAAPPAAKGVSDSLIRDATKLTGAALLGARGGQKAAEIVSNNKDWGRLLASYGSYFTTVASMNREDPTLVNGQNALVPLFEGATGKDGTISGDVMQKKINQGIDALYLGIPGVTFAHATQAVGHMINNLFLQQIKEGLSEKAIRMKVGREFFSQLGKYGEMDQKSLDNAVRYVQENRDELLTFADMTSLSLML